MHSPAIKHKDFVPFFPVKYVCLCCITIFAIGWRWRWWWRRRWCRHRRRCCFLFSFHSTSHNSFLHFHSFALYLAGILLIRRKEREERVSTKFDNTSEDMLCSVRCTYIDINTIHAIYFMNACARTKWMEKPPEKEGALPFSYELKATFFRFVYGVVLCCVVYV